MKIKKTKNAMLRLILYFFTAIILALLAPSISNAQEYLSSPRAVFSGTTGPLLIPEEAHGESPPLRDIPPLPPEAGITEMPYPYTPNTPHSSTSYAPDPVLQTSIGPLVSTSTSTNFDGLDENTIPAAGDPPDTNGAAGLTQYVQWVNRSFAIFDKANGQIISPPGIQQGTALWYGLGGPCWEYNDGDPIAQYDKIANRWVMMQPVFEPGSFSICVAVSTTSDATGSYYQYAFPFPWGNPDYPKLGVWPDGYYISLNNTTSGQAVACVLDRDNMLNGNGAKPMQCFVPNSSAPMLPSDLDGSNLPPQGSPNYFLQIGNPLGLYQFHVDWSNPANTTFNGPPTYLTVAPFNETCYGDCIPQYGSTTQLEGLGDRLMYRLAYRNFGDHEALVVNHSVDTGNGNVGIRWYEIRNPGSTPYVYQQGTYAPDSNYRWMGSIAMDQSGDIALGYSVSSSSMYPSIRYTGRVPTDQLGTMEGETSILEGTAPTSGDRFGDYSSMSIDPVDDCTFWYTTEYTKTAYWWANTRIASFKFPNCGGQYRLTTSFTPAGGGTVTPACSETCWENSGLVELTAIPNSGYIFSSWTGDCSGTSPLIFVDMDAPITCTANFVSCGSHPVQNTSTSYDSIQIAYDAANTLDTLRILGTTLTEDLNLDRAISITLSGGYNCDFSSNGSLSFIQGSLTITSGTAIINNLVIK